MALLTPPLVAPDVLPYALSLHWWPLRGSQKTTALPDWPLLHPRMHFHPHLHRPPTHLPLTSTCPIHLRVTVKDKNLLHNGPSQPGSILAIISLQPPSPPGQSLNQLWVLIQVPAWLPLSANNKTYAAPSTHGHFCDCPVPGSTTARAPLQGRHGSQCLNNGPRCRPNTNSNQSTVVSDPQLLSPALGASAVTWVPAGPQTFHGDGGESPTRLLGGRLQPALTLPLRT